VKSFVGFDRENNNLPKLTHGYQRCSKIPTQSSLR